MKTFILSSFALGSSLLATSASAQLVPPGASGSTTTSVYTQSVTRHLQQLLIFQEIKHL